MKTKMNLCLLCLKASKGKCIKFQSKKWQDENIEKLLQMHFWTMRSLSDKSWICASCWKIVKEFHDFYERIENSHEYLNEMQEISEYDNQQFENNDSTYNDILNNVEIVMSTGEDTPIKDKISVKEEKKLAAIKRRRTLPYHFKATNEDFNEVNENQMEPSSKRTRYSIRKASLINSPEKNIDIKKKLDTKQKDNYNDKSNLLEKSKESKSKKNTVRKSKANDVSDLDKENEPEKLYKLPKISKESKGKKDAVEISKGNDERDFDKKEETKKVNNLQAEDEMISKNFYLHCGICFLHFKTFVEMRTHSQKEHQQPGFTVCCEKKIYKRYILVDHILYHLDIDHFKCNDCGKVLQDRHSFKQHMQRHETPTHICDVCGKSYVRDYLLSEHKLIHVPKDKKQFSCEICDKRYCSLKYLKGHMRHVHQIKTTLFCNICDRRMISMKVYEQHMNEHQGILTEFKCDVCSKNFKNKKYLQRHVQLHSMPKGIKDKKKDKDLFACPNCTKTFRNRTTMNNHRKKCHPEEWLEGYKDKHAGNVPSD